MDENMKKEGLESQTTCTEEVGGKEDHNVVDEEKQSRIQLLKGMFEDRVLLNQGMIMIKKRSIVKDRGKKAAVKEQIITEILPVYDRICWNELVKMTKVLTKLLDYLKKRKKSVMFRKESVEKFKSKMLHNRGWRYGNLKFFTKFMRIYKNRHFYLYNGNTFCIIVHAG